MPQRQSPAVLPVILLIIGCSSSRGTSSSNNVTCKVGESCACQNNLMTCGGSKTDVIYLPAKVEMNPPMYWLSVVNSYLVQPQLSRHNFTSGYQHTKGITIQNTNLWAIHANTFANFNVSVLKIINFRQSTMSRGLIIHRHAFRNLNLETLDLSYNTILHLNKDSFSKLSVKKLVLVECGLLILDWRTLQPLFAADTPLRHLNLRANKLRTIDEKFSNSFRQLKTLNIYDNDLQCNDALSWLYKLLGSTSFRKKMIYNLSRKEAPLCSNGTPLDELGRYIVSTVLVLPPDKQQITAASAQSGAAGKLTTTDSSFGYTYDPGHAVKSVAVRGAPLSGATSSTNRPGVTPILFLLAVLHTTVTPYFRKATANIHFCC